MYVTHFVKMFRPIKTKRGTRVNVVWNSVSWTFRNMSYLEKISSLEAFTKNFNNGIPDAAINI